MPLLRAEKILFDARGQAIQRTPVGLWGASLPKIDQWATWINANRDRVKHGEPWVRFLLDATVKLNDTFFTMARIMRQKPNWQTTGWSQDEWKPIQDLVRERLAWFEQNKPSVESIPPEFEFFLDAIQGAFITMIRLADECAKALAHGYIPIRVSDKGVTPSFPERAEEVE